MIEKPKPEWTDISKYKNESSCGMMLFTERVFYDTLYENTGIKEETE